MKRISVHFVHALPNHTQNIRTEKWELNRTQFRLKTSVK